MAKLTKTQQRQLKQILDGLNWGRDYLMRPDTIVAKQHHHATTTLHYVRPSDGNVIYPIDKEIGSPLAGIHTASDNLAQFIAANT